MPLELNDILLVRGDLNKILELDRQHSISIAADLHEDVSDVKRVEMTSELWWHRSLLIGQSCRDLGLRKQFDVSVFALQRRGRHHQRDIADLELRMGDILLVRGTTEALENLRSRNEFILLEGVHDEVIESHKAPLALGTILVVVLLAAASLAPISVLALGGAAFLVLTKVLTARDAYRAIDWPVLVLIAGMIALGSAMDKTGALDIAADQLHGVIGEWGKHATLWVFYFMAAALSLLILNKPAAVLCAPLGIELAAKLGCNPSFLIMAVAFAASPRWPRPWDTRPTFWSMDPAGNYRDFVVFGMPLNIAGILVSLLIPLIWPEPE